jgi:hypothetical protein
MNSWINAAQYATEILAIVLVVRLLWLRERREGVYYIIIVFLLVQTSQSLIYFAYTKWAIDQIDYRLIWLSLTAFLAGFSLWLVYALAKAVLTELPGILRFSRTLLNVAFPLAIVIAFSTAKSEYGLIRGADPMDRLMRICSVADRGISMAAALLLLIILAFILWFPVKMSKNLAIFSIGFVVYFASKTGLDLIHLYSGLGAKAITILSTVDSVVLILCFLYWIFFIGTQGQTAQVRIGHSWRVAEQAKLLERLESLNGALMRTSQRMQM